MFCEEKGNKGGIYAFFVKLLTQRKSVNNKEMPTMLSAQYGYSCVVLGHGRLCLDSCRRSHVVRPSCADCRDCSSHVLLSTPATFSICVAFSHPSDLRRMTATPLTILKEDRHRSFVKLTETLAHTFHKRVCHCRWPITNMSLK